MNRFLQPLWLLLAFGLAIWLNHATRPRAEYALSIGERTMGTGSLRLQAGTQRQEFKLVTIHVIAEDVPRLLADPLVVRALWLRSPAEEGELPDLELFVDLANGAAPIAPDAHDVGLVRGRELAVLPGAVGDDVRSRVRFRGADAPALVSDGQLVVDEALPLGEPAQGWRVSGKVQLTLEPGGPAESLTGEFNARLVWD